MTREKGCRVSSSRGRIITVPRRIITETRPLGWGKITVDFSEKYL